MTFEHQHIFLSINCMPNFRAITIPEDTKRLLKTRELLFHKV